MMYQIGWGVMGIEKLEFSFLVADFRPSTNLYNGCVLNAVGVIMGRSVVTGFEYKNLCRMNGLWKFLTDYGFG